MLRTFFAYLIRLSLSHPSTPKLSKSTAEARVYITRSQTHHLQESLPSKTHAAKGKDDFQFQGSFVRDAVEKGVIRARRENPVVVCTDWEKETEVADVIAQQHAR